MGAADCGGQGHDHGCAYVAVAEAGARPVMATRRASASTACEKEDIEEKRKREREINYNLTCGSHIFWKVINVLIECLP